MTNLNKVFDQPSSYREYKTVSLILPEGVDISSHEDRPMTEEGGIRDLKTVSRAREKSFSSVSLSSCYYPLYNASTLQGSCPREVLCPGFRILGLGNLCTGGCCCDSRRLTGKCGNLLKPLNSQCWGWSFTYKMGLGCVCVERSLLTTKASLTVPSLPFSLPPSLSSARARPFVL